MSVATSAPGAPAPSPTRPVVPAESCPLCGTPLREGQEWCLHCGAAARTRLAAAPRWQVPMLAVALAILIALGVLAAALVKLAADSGPPPPPVTRTVTSPTAAVPPAASTLPQATTTLPATTAPGATTTPGAATPPAATTIPTTTAPQTPGAAPAQGVGTGGTQALSK